MPDQRLVLLTDHEGPVSSGEHTGAEIGAIEARARVELDRDWREAFGVPLSESVTDETAQVQSSDLIGSELGGDSERERTPATKRSPFHAILPPPLGSIHGKTFSENEEH